MSCTSEDTFEKIKVEAVAASHSNTHNKYKLILENEVMVEKRRVGRIAESSVFILLMLPDQQKFGDFVIAVTASLQEMAPDVQMIPTDMPVRKLVKRGFQMKNILDPILFYFSSSKCPCCHYPGSGLLGATVY